jgi:hypothetical protein
LNFVYVDSSIFLTTCLCKLDKDVVFGYAKSTFELNDIPNKCIRKQVYKNKKVIEKLKII